MRSLSRLVVSSLLAVLAGSVAWSGPLAPEMRVVASRDRDFIERSGAQTLEELLDTGIVRYFYAGGQTLLVLVDGRPYSTTAGDLDTLPLSAIERVELLSGEGLGQFGGIAVNGAINVVMRRDFDGFETRALTRMPGKDGGDSWQGSVFWGGPVGTAGGRMSIGVDVLRRQEIPSRSREFSRSAWQEGGSFSEARNVSVGGNTVYVADFEDSAFRGIRAVPLGDCDPAKGYAGPLRDPPSSTVPGDAGCGFAYGDIAWNTAAFEQRTAIMNLDLPLDGGRNLHLAANLGEGEWSFRYAPSVGTFRFTPTDEVLAEINDAAGNSFTADEGDFFAIGHRFLGHGNRDWHSGYGELDIAAGISGRLAEDLGYEAYVDAYRLDGSLVGSTFVHTGRIREEIADGNYDLINPDSPSNRQAIERSSLQEEIDFGVEYVGARLALEGRTFAVGGRKAAWTAGLDTGKSKVHSILRFRDNQGEEHDVTKVLGSGGVSYEGERQTIGMFGDMVLPLAESTDFRVAARGDEYDDLGGLTSYRLSAEHRPNEVLTLRSSWGAGDRPPSMRSLHSTAAQDHPYIHCDPGSGPPGQRSPCTSSNPRQVTREFKGNPELEPSETERLAVGAELRWSRFFLDVEWYRLERSGLPGLRNPDWAMRNLDECAGGRTSNCIARTGGSITIHDSFANIVDTEISGVTTRYRRSFGTDWGEIVLSGAWRHVTDAKRTVEGDEGRLASSRNMVRSRFEARRGDVTATWTVNFREGFRNQSNTGNFEDWIGHDFAVDWNRPMGIDDARITAGVFNLTDASLTVDTANPSRTDGPEAAGWGRTFFLTVNRSF